MRPSALRTAFFYPISALLLAGCSVSADIPASVRSIPVQHNGQVKSFESFSRQTLELVAEKDRWEGKSASRTVLDAASGLAEHMRWVRISYRELREKLGLEAERSLFTYEEVSPSFDAIASLAESSQKKRDEDLRPTMLEQKAEGLYSKLIAVKRLSELETLRVVPPASGEDWLAPNETPFGKPFLKLIEASKDPAALENEAAEWVRSIEMKTGGRYSSKMRMELIYYDLRPFHASWILYLASFVLISVFGRLRLGIAAAVVALLLHSAGLTLRVAILGRPPVSNMFESVVYMNWVVMVAALVFSAVRRQSAPVSVGALLSAIVMIYADLLPIDPSLEVLVPVLRSNYWLTIHVMTIVSSYGVLGFAMAMGHRHLILESLHKMKKKDRESSEKLIYRAIQVGTLLLGIGTTLGGVWANESWGRFWGWDPKETWALITFLGYLILIHLYYFNRIGAFALAVWSVAGFQLVLMTWYGVNFVLGRGLHSYGQGSGGAMWIVYYLIAESVFLAWVFLRSQKSLPTA